MTTPNTKPATAAEMVQQIRDGTYEMHDPGKYQFEFTCDDDYATALLEQWVQALVAEATTKEQAKHEMHVLMPIEEHDKISADLTTATARIAALETLAAKLKSAGDNIAGRFDPGPIPAPEPTDADLDFGHWAYVSSLTPDAIADQLAAKDAEIAELKERATQAEYFRDLERDTQAPLKRRAEAAEAKLHALQLVCGATDANKFETACDRAIARAKTAEASLTATQDRLRAAELIIGMTHRILGYNGPATPKDYEAFLRASAAQLPKGVA